MGSCLGHSYNLPMIMKENSFGKDELVDLVDLLVSASRFSSSVSGIWFGSVGKLLLLYQMAHKLQFLDKYL